MLRNQSLRREPVLMALLAAIAAWLCVGCAHETVASRPAAFWPAYPDEPRIQYLRSIEKSVDVQPPRTTLEDLALGKEPQTVLMIKLPYGVKLWHGRIYVCDINNSSVTIFDMRKKQVFVVGRSEADSMMRPSDIAIAPDGTKYVADGGRQHIFVYGADDRFVTSFPETNMAPVAIAVYQNELYVCDMAGQRVVVLDRATGHLLRTIGGPGMKFGQFDRPVGIAVDGQGNVYVMDVMKCQLQKFDQTGKLLLAFGQRGDNVGALARPKQIAVDKDGYIYVVDAAFQNVQVFDQRGRLLTYFGTPGDHLGAMNLPAGISVCDEGLDLFQEWVHPAFQPQRLILVTNQYGPGKVAIYALGKLKPGKTVADVRNSQSPGSTGLATGKSDNKLAGAPTTMPTAANPFAAGAPSTPNTFGPTLGPAVPSGQR